MNSERGTRNAELNNPMTKQVSAEAREAADHIDNMYDDKWPNRDEMAVEIQAAIDKTLATVCSMVSEYNESRATLPSAGELKVGDRIPVGKTGYHLVTRTYRAGYAFDMFLDGRKIGDGYTPFPSPPPPQPAAEGGWTQCKTGDRCWIRPDGCHISIDAAATEMKRELDLIERENSRMRKLVAGIPALNVREADLTAALREWKERADIRQDRIVELEAENARLAIKPASALTATSK